MRSVAVARVTCHGKGACEGSGTCTGMQTALELGSALARLHATCCRLLRTLGGVGLTYAAFWFGDPGY